MVFFKCFNIKGMACQTKIEDGNSVSESKLVTFLTRSIKNWQYKRWNENRLPDGSSKELKKGSLTGYVKGVGPLQSVQAAVLGNTNPPACDILIKNPYIVTIIEKILLDDAEHEDRVTNTLNDNYTLDQLKLISRYQFNRNTAHNLRD